LLWEPIALRTGYWQTIKPVSVTVYERLAYTQYDARSDSTGSYNEHTQTLST